MLNRKSANNVKMAKWHWQVKNQNWKNKSLPSAFWISVEKQLMSFFSFLEQFHLMKVWSAKGNVVPVSSWRYTGYRPPGGGGGGQLNVTWRGGVHFLRTSITCSGKNLHFDTLFWNYQITKIYSQPIDWLYSPEKEVFTPGVYDDIQSHNNICNILISCEK